jgi:radical SAM superfamily enzyme YgiQ (UPF0313 family)
MRLMLAMCTGLQVGYDGYFSSAPMGIETLAAHARKHAEVALADMRGRGQDVEAHAEFLLSGRPDMIGLSVNSAPHTKYALALGEALRRHVAQTPSSVNGGGLKLIVGGQQATFLPDEMLAPGHFDAVVRGEGELTLAEILTRGTFAGVQGVSWRNDGQVVHEPDRPLIEDVDSILPPARDLLPDRTAYRMGDYRVEGIESSRGCPFHCSFCSIRNFHRGRWRAKSVARVMREVDWLIEHYTDPMVIYFADDNFANNIPRVIEICKAIVERKSKAYFWCQARVDVMAKHPEVIEWMGKAHFAAVLAGIETSVPRLLKSARKGTSLEQISSAIELLHKQDIGVWGTFTLGLPGETAEETAMTAKFIPTANVDVAQITVATPIPGSDLYRDAKAGGQLLHTDWDQYDFTSPTMKGQLSKKELDGFMSKAYLQTYLSWKFLAAPFHKHSNLGRLRATAFGVFWTWIWYLIKDGLRGLFHLKRATPHRPQGNLADAKAGP